MTQSWTAPTKDTYLFGFGAFTCSSYQCRCAQIGGFTRSSHYCAKMTSETEEPFEAFESWEGPESSSASQGFVPTSPRPRTPQQFCSNNGSSLAPFLSTVMKVKPVAFGRQIDAHPRLRFGAQNFPPRRNSLGVLGGISGAPAPPKPQRSE